MGQTVKDMVRVMVFGLVCAAIGAGMVLLVQWGQTHPDFNELPKSKARAPFYTDIPVSECLRNPLDKGNL